MAKINMDQFAILADKAPSEGLYYKVNFGFNGAVDARRIACMFSIEFSHYEKPILKLGISCEFDIHNDDWEKNTTEDILTIPKEDLGLLANQTVGAARGIMFCKTEGTEFWNFILPPIDLTKILDEDLVIDFTNK